MNKESIDQFARFLTTLPYSALLYVASVEETGSHPEKAEAAYKEIKFRDAGLVCQEMVPSDISHKGDWRPYDIPERPAVG